MELLQQAMMRFQAERQRLEEELQQVDAVLGLLSSLPRAKPEHAEGKRDDWQNVNIPPGRHYICRESTEIMDAARVSCCKHAR